MSKVAELKQIKEENIALNILNEQLELLETFDWHCNEENIAMKIIKETMDLMEDDHAEFIRYYLMAKKAYELNKDKYLAA